MRIISMEEDLSKQKALNLKQEQFNQNILTNFIRREPRDQVVIFDVIF